MTNQLETLGESIRFSANMLAKLESKPELLLEHKIILSLYRKLIEQLDGNYTLADHELVGPTKVMIRSAFETYLSIKYILENKKFVKDRAFCYYVAFCKSQISISNELIDNPITGIDIEQLKTAIKIHENILNEPALKKVLDEWDRTKVEVKRYKNYDPTWYALFNGPTSVKQLLEKIGDADDYRLYGSLSQEAHGYQALNGLNNIDLINEPFSLKPIRGAFDGELQEHLSRALCTSSSLHIIKLIAPEFENELISFAKEIGLLDKNYPYDIPDMTIRK